MAEAPSVAALCAVHCPECGSYPGHPRTATSWRWVADHWEHRCPDLHPQVGTRAYRRTLRARVSAALRRWLARGDEDD